MAFTFDSHSNLCDTTVATAPSPATSGVSLVVAAGTGAWFPTAPFNATIGPAGAVLNRNNSEIVRVTARSTDTLTITRAQEGTTARTVIAGDRVIVAPTVLTLTNIEGYSNTLVAEPRMGYLRVASADAPADVRDQADYVCTGSNDQTVINQALVQASRPADGYGGTGEIGVMLVGPTFYIGNNGTTGVRMISNTCLSGHGTGTLLRSMIPTDVDLGVVELLNTETMHVTVQHLSIGAPRATAVNGHGIKFVQSGFGGSTAFDINTGGDPYNKIYDVTVLYVNRYGIWLSGTNGGSRESQLRDCLVWQSGFDGIFVDNSSDSQITDCRSNPRLSGAHGFHISGGNTKISNCKAYYVEGTGDGFRVAASRAEVSDCAAQDCGSYGFNFTSGDVTASGLVADSNMRQNQAAAGFRIAADGTYMNLAAFDRDQTPLSRQNLNFVFASSPLVNIIGRSKAVVQGGGTHISGAPGTGSTGWILLDNNASAPSITKYNLT